MDAAQFNHDKYEELWDASNLELRKIHETDGLPEALRALKIQQFDQGFIQDDLKSVLVYQFPDLSDQLGIKKFSVQFNPKRAFRTGGAGRPIPPPGTTGVNGNCFLCKDNVRWQQRGIELGYDLVLKNSEKRSEYIAWMNPFPLMPIHATIAKKDHEPQSWIGRSIESILKDFLEITRQLPDFIGFYNGEGAGASIPHHFHFQFFERPRGKQLFSLELAARQIPRASVRDYAGVLNYPITSIYCHGIEEFIVEKVITWLNNWTNIYKNNLAVSANIIATLDENENGKFHLYFVPRNKFVSHAAGMVGMIGGLEVLGELVFSSDDEKKRLDSGGVSYESIAQILKAVEAPGVREFLRTI